MEAVATPSVCFADSEELETPTWSSRPVLIQLNF